MMHPDRDFVNRTNCGFLANASCGSSSLKKRCGDGDQEALLKHSEFDLYAACSALQYEFVR